MASSSSQPNYFNFPHFLPPSPNHALPPSPRWSQPPPPPHIIPPPPYHPFSPPPPTHILPPPPPPSHLFPPPPPHAHPPPTPSHPFSPPPHHPPPPFPPPPSPDNHPTVIVIVFISLGGVFFLAFLALALCCFIKKRKMKTVQETDIIYFDEHRKVNEVIVPGLHGPQAVILSVEDDVCIDEVIKKNEKFGSGSHAKSQAGQAISGEHDLETTSSGHHQLEHKP